MKKAVIIIPTYNERENIEIILPKVLAATTNIAGWNVQVLVVDDNSPDKTWQVVKQFSQKSDRVHLHNNPKKSGLGGAYLVGMAVAFDSLHADVVFEFDADGSHDPLKIPDFLDAIDAGADMVLGSRYRKGGSIPANWGFHRKFLSVIGNTVIQLILFRPSIRDWTGGFRAISKKVYDSVHPQLHTERFSGYTFQIGFLHKAVQQGFSVVEVPFHFVDRTIGESKLGVEYIKNTLLYIIKARLTELYRWRFFKFALVGASSAIIQLTLLSILRPVIGDYTQLFMIPVVAVPFTGFLLAQLLSIECAVMLNFVSNNFWTFADRKVTLTDIPIKFATFNAASFGSILVQFLIAFIGKWTIGLHPLWNIAGFQLDTGLLFAVTGIGLGTFWNYFAYNFFVWNKK